MPWWPYYLGVRINPFTAKVITSERWSFCEVVLTLTSVDKIPWCNHSNELDSLWKYCAGFQCRAIQNNQNKGPVIIYVEGGGGGKNMLENSRFL